MKVTKNFQKHDNKIEPKASKKNQRIPKIETPRGLIFSYF